MPRQRDICVECTRNRLLRNYQAYEINADTKTLDEALVMPTILLVKFRYTYICRFMFPGTARLTNHFTLYDVMKNCPLPSPFYGLAHKICIVIFPAL